MASQIKPILFLILILLTPFLIQMVVVQTVPETIVKLEPYASSANVGETFTVNVTVVDVQNLYGVEVTLYWNSSILEPVNIDIRLGEMDGVLRNPIYIAQNSTQKGKYLAAATSIAPAPSFNGSGNIVRLTFRVINSGDSKLHVETQLYDYPPPDREPRISLPIDHITVDGNFDVNPPTIGIPLCMPSDDVLLGQYVKVSVSVKDSTSGVKNVSLLYTVNNGSTWEVLIMNPCSSTGFYETMIPPQQAETMIRFKIIAYDYAENVQVRNGQDPYFTYIVTLEDTGPPDISVLSPENKTYGVNDVALTFTVGESISWIGFSLDGQVNQTLFAENVTLSGLSSGSHNLIVYASDMAGNTGASERIFFTIKVQQPTLLPTLTIATIVTSALVGVLLIYLTKGKKKRQRSADNSKIQILTVLLLLIIPIAYTTVQLKKMKPKA